jgi:DNA-binding LytR/AlgR family response regulator
LKVEVKIDKNITETTIIILAKELDDEVYELQQNIANIKPNAIIGFSGYRLEFINQDDIVRVYASLGNVYIVTSEKEYRAKSTLGELEELLNKHNFLRISRSDIINLNNVKSFDLSFVGTISVELINGDTVYVSRRKLKDVKNYLGI